MLLLMPLLRHRLTFFSNKNVVHLINKNNLHNLARCQICESKSVHIVYRLQKYSNDSPEKDVTVSSKKQGEVSTTFSTVKETSKTLWYGLIFIAGLSVTGFIFSVLYTELFSANSPHSVYFRTLEKCKADERVIFNLGEPIKGSSEEIGDRRKRNLKFLPYEKDGVNYLRMKFAIIGSRKNGVVHLEMQQNEKGNYEYRYLFVQVDGYPYTTIVLEDNRSSSPVNISPMDSPNLM